MAGRGLSAWKPRTLAILLSGGLARHCCDRQSSGRIASHHWLCAGVKSPFSRRHADGGASLADIPQELDDSHAILRVELPSRVVCEQHRMLTGEGTATSTVW